MLATEAVKSTVIRVNDKCNDTDDTRAGWEMALW